MSECYCCGGKGGQHKGPCASADWCKHGRPYKDNCEFCKETADLRQQLAERKAKAKACGCDAGFEVRWLEQVLESLGCIVRDETKAGSGVTTHSWHNERAEAAEERIADLEQQLAAAAADAERVKAERAAQRRCET